MATRPPCEQPIRLNKSFYLDTLYRLQDDIFLLLNAFMEKLVGLDGCDRRLLLLRHRLHLQSTMLRQLLPSA